MILGTQHGPTMRAPRTWTPDGLTGLLRARPLTIDTPGDVGDYAARRGSIGGASGDALSGGLRRAPGARPQGVERDVDVG